MTKTKKNRWAIGIDVGGTKVAAAHVDHEGVVHKEIVSPSPQSENPSALIDLLVDMIKELRRVSKVPPVGVGIGMAGQIDSTKGVVHFSPNMGWHDVPLKKLLAKTIDLPIYLTNDVRAATLAEWHYGAGRGCQDFVCLFIGTGIGGGIVSNGELVCGHSETAGELGHMTIDFRGRRCTCGNVGCLETLAAGWAIAQNAQEAIRENRGAGAALLKLAGGRSSAITAKEVIEGFYGGDYLSKKLVDEVIEALVAGAVSIVHAFNPERIILGGGIVHGLPELVDSIEEGVRSCALEAALKRFSVVPAALQGQAGVIGAAYLAFLTSVNTP